jgi:hypothetical protein
MTPIEWLNELRDWFAALSPQFAFLLALPFVVAALGLLRLLLVASPRAARKDAQPRQRTTLVFPRESAAAPHPRHPRQSDAG